MDKLIIINRLINPNKKFALFFETIPDGRMKIYVVGGELLDSFFFMQLFSIKLIALNI